MAYSEFKTEEEFKENCGYDIDGVWYPRVTRITDMKAKPALYRFYGSVGFDRGREIANKSAEEGTLVHELAEQMLVGDLPVNVDERVAPSLNALWEFLQKNKVEVNPDHVEMRVVNNEHLYAGTLDVLAKINGKFGLLDIKTSESIYRDYNIQTSAYMDSLVRDFDDLKTRWILRIDQNQSCKRCGANRRVKGGREKIKRAWKQRNGFGGHYDVVSHCKDHEHDWGPLLGEIELKELPLDWQKDFNAFLGAKALWEWEHSSWLERIGYRLKDRL
ncbi:MAG: hypothetical protein Q8Q32_00240 [bacterium]|nr:hypothetical protein [bacterium]